MARIVISEFMDEQAVAWLGEHHEVLCDTRLVEDRGRLLDAVADADALIVRNRTQVDSELLTRAPRPTRLRHHILDDSIVDKHLF